jgi:hypothetical protein
VALERAALAVTPVEGIADRLLVGRTREGCPEVRLALGPADGVWRGAVVRLVRGAHGIEATVITTSEAARRAVEGQLVELARALEARGVVVTRCEAWLRAEADDEARRRAQRRERR